jgi:hypothetical protein
VSQHFVAPLDRCVKVAAALSANGPMGPTQGLPGPSMLIVPPGMRASLTL